MKSATSMVETRSRTRWLVVAAAAVVFVGVAIGALALRSGGTNAPTATDTNGIPAVVHDSVAALAAGNYEDWRAVRSADARLSDGHPVVADSPLARFIQRHGELEFELSVVRCDETPSSTQTRTFECDLEGSEAIMRAAGVQGHATWTYVIEEGRIIESSPPFFDNGAEVMQAHGALARHLREVAPAAFEEVCNRGDLDLFNAGLGPECTTFIREHLEGFARTEVSGDS